MEQIAAVYARALFEATEQAGRLDEVREHLGQLVDALEEQRDMQIFFFSPYFSTEEKRDGLNRTVSDADPLLTNFLELLIENHRMPVIFRMRRELDRLWEEHNRLLGVQVTSAIPLEPAAVAEIGRRVGEQTGRRVELTSEVDPDILGGIVLRVGNAILDASIRNRLELLRKEVARA
ncbi:MAG TPA: ATP synthase F1 subunit delta [Solirubrobacteraceae bacterium]|jgi:ATP synthase F1 delta subunit|nr:ATP synthase F1 subunit delta [Solirubrobacteraceae bacterium]